MELTKSFSLPASPERVWTLLLNPKVMTACVPGMQSVNVLSPSQYEAVLQVKLSFLSAKFKLAVEVVETRPPHYLRSIGTGEDKSIASSLKQTTEILLTALPNGNTEVKMHVAVDVFGRIGSFGLNAIKTKADRLWQEFAENLKTELEQYKSDPAVSS